MLVTTPSGEAVGHMALLILTYVSQTDTETEKTASRFGAVPQKPQCARLVFLVQQPHATLQDNIILVALAPCTRVLGHAMAAHAAGEGLGGGDALHVCRWERVRG